eukprot:NODE_132_length_16614_cov_0.935392.p10 type:complete len:223 gc:universal NODE_132_length_16614_cov_0.935392:4580-3912(-)
MIKMEYFFDKLIPVFKGKLSKNTATQYEREVKQFLKYCRQNCGSCTLSKYDFEEHLLCYLQINTGFGKSRQSVMKAALKPFCELVGCRFPKISEIREKNRFVRKVKKLTVEKKNLNSFSDKIIRDFIKYPYKRSAENDQKILKLFQDSIFKLCETITNNYPKSDSLKRIVANFLKSMDIKAPTIEQLERLQFLMSYYDVSFRTKSKIQSQLQTIENKIKQLV